MKCTPQRHVCVWSKRLQQVEQLLTRYLAGTPAQALAVEHGLDVAEVHAVAATHGLPEQLAAGLRQRLGTRPRACCPGAHTCLWADRGGVVDQLIDSYGRGRSINELSRTFPYSRATAARILDAHRVPRRSRSEQCTRIPLDLEEVQRELDEGLPLTQVAQMHKLSRQMLRRRLDRASAAA
jgi:hypothetical protein